MVNCKNTVSLSPFWPPHTPQQDGTSMCSTLAMDPKLDHTHIRTMKVLKGYFPDLAILVHKNRLLQHWSSDSEMWEEVAKRHSDRKER